MSTPSTLEISGALVSDVVPRHCVYEELVSNLTATAISDRELVSEVTVISVDPESLVFDLSESIWLSDSIFCLLAEGTSITSLKDGSFSRFLVFWIS